MGCIKPSPEVTAGGVLPSPQRGLLEGAVTLTHNGRAYPRPTISLEDLPPLPQINDQVLHKRVFTHRSVYARPTHVFEDPPDDPSPDNETLEHLGDSVLSLVITERLRDVYPSLRVGPSTKIRALVVGNATLADISVKYGLHQRLIPHPAQAVTLRASTHIQADLFEAYVGAVYLDGGLGAVKDWLNKLFLPYIREAYRMTRVQHGLSPEPSHPSEPTSPRLHMPNSVSPPSRNVPSSGHLSLFNQRVQQKNLAVEWEFADSAGQGSRTTPIWVVRAMVDGECLGRGRGSTKKVAKNEAAKEGLVKLGELIYQSSNET